MKKALRMLKNTTIFILIFACFLEIASWLYIRFINPNIPLPTYSFVNASSKFWVYIDKNFGVWHEPNSNYLHNKSCFVVQYHANSKGMRDKERDLIGKSPRVILMGDSFIEGWGNEPEDRLSDRLERSLGHEVLNFGTSGSFGTIQEWQQYKHMVSKFDHDVVMLGILPHNDFKDNDYEYAIRTGDDAYRPYLTGIYPDLKLVYLNDTLPERNHPKPLLRSFDFTLREWSSFYRVMRYLGSYRIRDFKLKSRWLAEHDDAPSAFPSRYHEYTPLEWRTMKYAIEQIVQEATGKKIIIFTIPTHTDFVHYDGTQPALVRDLQELANDLDFTYVDLLKEMADKGINAKDIFFVCDNHWNSFGNEVAAEILEPFVERALQ